MKLASLKGPSRDGTLILVNADLSRAVQADGIAPTLQHALEHWDTLQRKLLDAAVFWRRYLALDGSSEWAMHARRALKFCEIQIAHR